MTLCVQLPEPELGEIAHVLVLEADGRCGNVGGGMKISTAPSKRDRHCVFPDTGRRLEKNVISLAELPADKIKSLSLCRPPLSKGKIRLPQHVRNVLK